jgi:hypothetical protein
MRRGVSTTSGSRTATLKQLHRSLNRSYHSEWECQFIVVCVK